MQVRGLREQAGRTSRKFIVEGGGAEGRDGRGSAALLPLHQRIQESGGLLEVLHLIRVTLLNIHDDQEQHQQVQGKVPEIQQQDRTDHSSATLGN